MESARILAEVINKDLKNIANITNRYFIKTLGIRKKLFLKIFKMPFMYNKFLRKLVMKSGIKAIKKIPR